MSGEEETNNSVRISNLLASKFEEFWQNCDSYLYKVAKGGRSSGKSTTIGIRIPFEMMRTPVNALIVRKVANTLAESVYEQICEGIDMLGVGHLWKRSKNPLQLTYIPFGTKIIFRGADDPSKLKSIKTSKHPIAILWIEELAEFKTEEEVSIIVKSVVRGVLPEGLRYSVFYSYNPPKRKQSWVNKVFNSAFIPENTYVHHSTTYDNPFLSDEALEDIEYTREHNELKWKWESLGEAIGGGIIPFNNLTFRKISDDEIRSFDNIRQGLDFGYAADPCAFVRMHYDKTRRKLYIFDEYYKVKQSNRQIAEWLTSKGYHHTITTADSAEPKSIDEIKSYGVRITGASKGPGSVETGEKWLDDLEEIIIDPIRCPHTASEYENIDYAVDRFSEISNRLDDKDNHSIDATRYGVESDIGKRAPIVPDMVSFGNLM